MQPFAQNAVQPILESHQSVHQVLIGPTRAIAFCSNASDKRSRRTQENESVTEEWASAGFRGFDTFAPEFVAHSAGSSLLRSWSRRRRAASIPRRQRAHELMEAKFQCRLPTYISGSERNFPVFRCPPNVFRSMVDPPSQHVLGRFLTRRRKPSKR